MPFVIKQLANCRSGSGNPSKDLCKLCRRWMGFVECMPDVSFIGYCAALFAPSRSDRYEALNTIQFLFELKFFLDRNYLIEYAVNL